MNNTVQIVISGNVISSPEFIEALIAAIKDDLDDRDVITFRPDDKPKDPQPKVTRIAIDPWRDLGPRNL